MKKYFSYISNLILLLLIIFTVGGFFVPIFKVQAQEVLGTCTVLEGDSSTEFQSTQENCQYPNVWTPQGGTTPANTAGKSTNWWDILYPVTWIAGAFGWLSLAVLKIASWLTYLSGTALNYVVQYTVVDMKVHLNEAKTINDAWKVIRDVSNMGFIFILLYAAIRTILGIGDNTKKLIVNVIVVAILINFSLFFTKVIIDTSNVLAVTFYDAIAPGALSSNASIGLSNSLMQPLGVQAIWKIATGFQGEQLLIIGVMGTVVSLIVAFVFFAVSLLFIIRFVVLIFVLILSPIAFMAYVFPELKKHAEKWKDALIGQAFFAPIYFMLTWVVIVVARGMPTNTGNWASVFVGTPGAGGTAQVLPPSTSDVGIIVNFIIIIAMLITSLVIAKDWAGKAGGGVGKLTGWAMGAAGASTLGLAGRFGRGTVGRAGNALAENEWLKDKAPTSRLARLGLAASRKTAGTSFDLRGTGIGKQLDAGKGQTGGFAKDLKDKIEAQKKYADSTFKPSDLRVMQAERKLGEAKKTGKPEDIHNAQVELDKISGVSEDALRQRQIKEFRALGDSKRQAKEKLDKLEDKYLQEVNRLTKGGMSQEKAEEDARSRNIGWAPKPEKGLLNTRKEAYATTIETEKVAGKIPFSLTGRHLVFGPVKSEGRLAANAIRKSIKEKKPGEKIAEEIEKQAKESSDDSGGTTTTTTVTTTTAPVEPSSTPPSGGTPTP